MTGKKFIANLKPIIETAIDIPVYLFDTNEERKLPCVVLGYENEKSISTLNNFEMESFILIIVNGYDQNNDASALESDILGTLGGDLSALNKPLSGTDTRPQSGITVEGLFFTGSKRMEEDDSTLVQLDFEVFTSGTD